MKFKRIVFEFPEMHRRQARFEEDTAVILALTAEDVFQVQTSIFFYEEAAGAGSMFQTGDAVVSTAMITVFALSTMVAVRSPTVRVS